ncbi:MAG: calcium-binding protein, partial [Pseudomonadota bacterium]
DEIRGGRGHDDLTGGAGEDTIYGGRGHDEIFGGADDDLLIGGYGNDELTGGAGSDIFQFGGAGAATADTVLDFNVDDDLVALRSEGFGQTGDVTVTLGAAASGTGAQFVYNSANGELRFDANGSNGGQSSLVATFTPGLALEEDNFTFV